MNTKFQVGNLARCIADRSECAFIKKIERWNLENYYVFYLINNPENEYVQITELFDQYHEKPYEV